MLQGVEAKVGLAGCVGVAVDGDYAAFFAELGVFFREQGTGIRDRGRRSRAGAKLIGFVEEAFDSLEEQPAHAGTSPWRVASRAVAQGFFRLASEAEIMGWR